MLDSHGSGVEGKYPESIEVSNISDPLAKIEVRINGKPRASQASGEDGIMIVPIRFLFVSKVVSV